MKKISQVLIESEGTRKQITGHLVDVDIDGKPCGYCALGALACENGLIINEKSNSDLDYPNILESYGVNPDIQVKDPMFDYESNLVTVIYRLNDRGWSFKKIGNYIKKLEKKGVIKYED